MRALLDHVVLEVQDAGRSAAFYRAVLGFSPLRLAAFQRGAAPFVSARVNPTTVVDFFPPKLWRGDSPQNPNHVCFTLSARAVAAVERRLRRRGIRIASRASRNFGAQGFAESIYFDDPDGVSVEVRHYRRTTILPT